MTKKLPKKKIIILAIITVVLVIGAVVAILFVRWNNYYNKIWTPLTTIAYNTKCDDYPNCGICNNQPDTPMIHKKYSKYYFELPEKLKYQGAVSYSHSIPFDKSIEETQYEIFVDAIIGKDFSDIKWVISIGVNESLTYGYNVFDAVIDPDTLEVLEVIYKREDIDYMKECEDMIREGISNLRSVYSPYLG